MYNALVDDWKIVGIIYKIMILGVHVSIEGKIYNSLRRARTLGCNTMQIFSRSPQKWRQADLDPEDVRLFNQIRARYAINPLCIHIPYLINLASPDRRLFKASVKAYVEDIKEAAVLGAEYIVTHMGSHKNTSEQAGIKRLIKALDIILEKTADINVGILLENTSGSGSWLGYKFSHQKKVIAGLIHKDKIGFCLDTAHAYLAGYDIAKEVGLSAMLEEIEDCVGVERVKLIHLNDAKDPLGSHRDRHEHIGKGMIGLEGMRRIINHPELRDKVFIMETPKDFKNADEKNLEIVRNLRK